MRTIEYRHREDERKEWGPGPWDDEPDKIQWQDESTGLPCLVVRGPLGAWCGYVGVPEGHPCFEVEHDNVGVDVHGSELTFSEFCAPDGKEQGICHVVEPGENDRVWWLGFDCAHFRDLVPAMTKYPVADMQTYRTVDYARSETRRLAEQLAEMS